MLLMLVHHTGICDMMIYLLIGPVLLGQNIVLELIIL